MTQAAQLLTALQALGVTLAAEGDRLRFYPRDAVTGDLLARLRDAKPELLAMLQPQDLPGRQPLGAGGGPEMLPTGNKIETSPTGDTGQALQPQSVAVPRTRPVAAVPLGILADPVTNCSDCGRRVVGGQPGRPAGLCFSCWSKRR